MNAYNFEISGIDGTKDILRKLNGKLSLFVNIATKAEYQAVCSPIWSYARTCRQLWELQQLHEMFYDLTVVGFPCNQFGAQEPASNEKINEFVRSVYPFVTFPIAEKVDVNGDNEHPLFSFLKGTQKRIVSDTTADTTGAALAGHNKANQAMHRIPHNYEKFLIGRSGDVIHRFSWGEFPMDKHKLHTESKWTIIEAVESALREEREMA
jgi:glutathione peroxidase